MKIEVYCDKCDKKFLKHKCEMKENNFCSRSCAAKYNRNKKLTKQCRWCGNYIYKVNETCDQNCNQMFQLYMYINRWQIGLETGISSGNELSFYIRRYLFILNQNKCQKCGWDIVHLITNKVPLHVHHIDGNYLNNKFYNLELLCPNCHSLTFNYGSLNRGNGNVDRLRCKNYMLS